VSAGDPSLDVDTLIVAGAAVAFSIWTGIASYRSRREQAKAAREKVEEEAFLRVQTMYTNALEIQGKELKTNQDRIAELNRRIHELEEDIWRLRTSGGERHGYPRRGTDSPPYPTSTRDDTGGEGESTHRPGS
jgi:predicted RNase H-like nuclease (RuvC/YqgF family)